MTDGTSPEKQEFQTAEAQPGCAITVMALPQHEPKRLSGLKFVTIIIALLLSIFLISLDESMTATAVPRIVSQFNGLSQVSWVGTAYFLTQAAFYLPFGQCLTIAPIKYSYAAAILLFEIGCLIRAVSKSMQVFILGHAVSGCGAAGILISALSVIVEMSPLERRPLLQSFLSATFGASSISGLLIGGALTDHTTWRWCFYINLPFGFISLVTIYTLLDANPPPERTIYSGKTMLGKWISVDWIGMILMLGLTAALLLPLQWGGNIKAWDDPAVIACFCVAGVLVIAFIGWEYRQGDYALLVARTIKRTTFIGAALEAFFIFGSQTLGIYYIPLWFQAAKGFSATKAGLYLIPLQLSCLLAAAFAGSIITRTGRYWLWLCLPPLLATIGGGLLYTITPDTPMANLIGYQILLGVGVGAPFQNLFIAAQAELSKEPSMIPQTNSFISFVQLLGPVVSIALAGTVFGNKLAKNIALYVPDLSSEFAERLRGSVSVVSELDADLRIDVGYAYSRSLTPAFLMIVPFSILAAVCSFMIKDHDLKKIAQPRYEDS